MGRNDKADLRGAWGRKTTVSNEIGVHDGVAELRRD
jgi:hypothetical protein